MSKRRVILLAVTSISILSGVATRFWLLSLVPATNDVPTFTPPNEAQRRAAIGPTDGLTPELRRAFEPADHFVAMPVPGPSDWLAHHIEGGQGYDQFVRSQPNLPDQQRRKLYLEPLGAFPAAPSPDLNLVREFAEAFFALPVEVRPRVELAGLPISSRQRGGQQPSQLLTADILEWLKTRVPEDAYCLLAITMHDLYPDEDWNYVFGQASLRERVGVYSFARYDPGFYEEARNAEAQTLILRRSCKVLAHETGHMFGMVHCIYFRCLMNGANHLGEDDATPLHLCPVCLRKLQHAVGFDIPARYEQLRAFSQQAGFEDEAAWLTRRLEYITAEPGPQKHPAL